MCARLVRYGILGAMGAWWLLDLFCCGSLLLMASRGLGNAAMHPHLLFLDRHYLQTADPRLVLRVQQPTHGPWVLTPTEPWEAWAISAYSSVIAGDGKRPHRMYYGESKLFEVNVSPPGIITRTAAIYGLIMSVAVCMHACQTALRPLARQRSSALRKALTVSLGSNQRSACITSPAARTTTS